MIRQPTEQVHITLTVPFPLSSASTHICLPTHVLTCPHEHSQTTHIKTWQRLYGSFAVLIGTIITAILVANITAVVSNQVGNYA